MHGWILPRKPSNNPSFVHTLGITKLEVVLGKNKVNDAPESRRTTPTNLFLLLAE